MNLTTSKKEKTDSQINRSLIIKSIGKNQLTANECIEKIFAKDIKSNKPRSWKFYVHLNKLFRPMEIAGMIKQVDIKKGPTGKSEKVWSVFN